MILEKIVFSSTILHLKNTAKNKMDGKFFGLYHSKEMIEYFVKWGCNQDNALNCFEGILKVNRHY